MFTLVLQVIIVTLTFDLVNPKSIRFLSSLIAISTLYTNERSVKNSSQENEQKHFYNRDISDLDTINSMSKQGSCLLHDQLPCEI